MVDNRTYAVMFESAGRWRARRSSVPGWGTEYRRCSCSLLNTSQSTRSRTSGSRCRSSGRSSISSRHTHASSSHQPARMPPYFVGTSFEACKTVSPWVCLLGTHTHTHRHPETRYIEEEKKKKNHCLEKLYSFQVQNWDCGCVYQMEAAEKKILIIDCQPVQNIVQISCYLQSKVLSAHVVFFSFFFFLLMFSCEQFDQLLYSFLMSHFLPRGPSAHSAAFPLHIIRHVRETRNKVRRSNNSEK